MQQNRLPKKRQKSTRSSLLLLFALLIFTVCPKDSLAQHRCEDLTKLSLKGASIVSAESYAAGAYKPPYDPFISPPRMTIPAFCRVIGVAKPSSDSEIRFEVWLPFSGWNGKFEQVGNGGLAGTIPQPAMVEPLLRGYAAAGTDDGHTGGPADGSWALGHPEKVIDYGYRAVHETAIQAREIVLAFYGSQPAKSYFVGCSDGGREALMEAQRFPDDFHGIVAGAPAAFMMHLGFKMAQDQLAVHETPASHIPPAKLEVLQKAVMDKCDRLDGVKDGLVSNPPACRFDPATIACKGADAPGCLTAAQVKTVKAIYGPAKNSRTGAVLSPGFSPGTEGVPENWAVWITGATPDKLPFGAAIVEGFFANIVFNDPKWDVRTLNFDSDVDHTDQKLDSIMNADNPDLSAFKAHGGKLIQYHGWGDSAIPPQDSIDYFASVQKTMGSTEDFYRLFMVPGMSHCGGGIGANVFGNERIVPNPDSAHDVTMALDQWVEHGTAPSSIIGTQFTDNDTSKAILMTRPLCPYPQQAHYKGTGDIHSAASFTCQAPSTK